MSEELRILMVEDVATDAEIELRELRRAGLAFVSKIVDTENGFRRELQALDPDIVLSDFSLPGFTGLDALEICRHERPDIPFIFVSGTIGEESAVAALRHGATDYVLKTNLQRFAPAVRRAVEEARERKARQAAERRAADSERYFSMFMRHLPASAYTKDLEGRFTFANPTFEELTGKTGGKIIGLKSEDLYPPDYIPPLLANDRKVFETRQPYRAVERVRFDQNDRLFLVTKFPIKDDQDNIAMLGGIAIDITDRIEVENALAASEERFRGIVETTDEWVWEANAGRKITYSNPAVERILGFNPQELMDGMVRGLVDEGDRARLDEMAHRATESGERWHGVVLRWRHKDGSLRWLESNGMPILRQDRTLLGFRGADRDVTDRILQEQKLDRLSRIRQVLGSLTGAIVRLQTPEDLCRELCRIAVEVGQFRMAWAGLLHEDAHGIHPVASHGAAEEILKIITSDGNLVSLSLDVPATRAVRQQKQVVVHDIGNCDMSPLWKRVALEQGLRACAALPLISGQRVIGVAVLFSAEPEFFDTEQLSLLGDLAADAALALDRMENQRQIDYLSYYDGVTGIANRTLLLERLQQFLHEAERSNNRTALMVLDIERFRNINESLGRGAGDTLLRLFADRLREDRGEDRVSRTGMNSFAVVLTKVTDDLHASRLVEERRAQLLIRPFDLDGREIRIAARSGVAIFPNDGRDPETLVHNAEAALMRAKQTGETTVYYTPKLNADVAERLALENRLRTALQLKQFVLHFQPKISLASGEIEGFEALLRWNDPEQGLVPPIRFIPLLEETGLIAEVGQWALLEAARVFRAWKAAGLPARRIAVNVSAFQLRQRGFADFVREVLGDDGPEAGIDIEITETMVMRDMEHSVTVLQALRDAGVLIAMDDFGTGYSSLGYLAKLPVDYLKIDRSFVRTLSAKSGDLAIVSAIISMANSLGLKTIAEGVETREQLDLLKALGCHQAQGYFISHPLPEDQAVSFRC